MDNDTKRVDIAELREQIIGELMPFDDGAAVLDVHPKTLKRWNPPVIRVGRSDFLHRERFREWVLNGCRPVESPERRRGRRAA